MQAHIGYLPETVIEHHLFQFLTPSDMVNMSKVDRWVRRICNNSKYYKAIIAMKQAISHISEYDLYHMQTKAYTRLPPLPDNHIINDPLFWKVLADRKEPPELKCTQCCISRYVDSQPDQTESDIEPHNRGLYFIIVVLYTGIFLDLSRTFYGWYCRIP